MRGFSESRRALGRAHAINHYPRHVGDFIRDTVGLSLAERGAYTALLDQYYASEKPLPLDAGERYRMAAATSAAERKAVDYVVSRYFTEQADGWHQKRADKEIAAYRSRADTARANGQFGGRPRTETVTENKPTGFSDGSQKKANQEPVTRTSNQELQEREAVANAPPPPPKTEVNGKNGHRAARLAEGWRLPDDWRDWAVKAHNVEPDRAVRISLDFRDFWHAKAGKDACKLDWFATWRRWVRRECGDV